MHENEIFENDHFIMIKRLLMIMCIWPFQTGSLKLYGRAFIIAAIMTVELPQMIKLYREWYSEDRDFQIIIENFTGIVYILVIFSKLYLSIRAEKKLQQLYKEMTKDYKEIQEPGERAAMIELWNFARILCIAYASYLFISLCFFVFSPIVVPAILDVIWPMNESRPKTLCHYAEYFIDQDKYLYYLTFQTFIVLAITILILASVDSSFMIAAYHILGLFNLITYRLKQLCEYANDNIHREDEQLHDFVIDTIKIHKRTLDLADLVRITYNECNFFVFGLIVAALSIGSIDIAVNLTNPVVLLRIGLIWCGVVLYLFFLNWPGQRFLDSGDDLLVSIYACNWYKLPTRTQFLIKFMMMRCLIPSQLTAGPLIQMNFASYGLILRTAMSYFTAVTSLG